MNELFKMLDRGEMPNFLEVLAALNDVSDIDWDRVEASLLSAEQTFKACKLPNTPKTCGSKSCAVC